MSNKDGDMIAAKFMQHKVAGTGNVKTDIHGEILNANRLTTDGESIFSYEWWPVAFWIDGATIAVTTDDFEYPVTRRRWKGRESYEVERMQKSPTTRHHVDSARCAVVAAGFEETNLTLETYLEYGGGKRHFRLYRSTNRHPDDFTPSTKRNKHNAELTIVSFPKIQEVNGLTIRGWMLYENDEELFPAFYCGEFDAIRGGYASKNYKAAPLYSHEAEGSEVCDVCLCPLSESAFADYTERAKREEEEYQTYHDSRDAEYRENPGGYAYNFLEALDILQRP